MTDLLLGWFSIYGLPLLVVALIFGQIGIPIPTSILLLTIGALLADSIYTPWFVFVIGVIAASIGDQTGYWVGRLGGHALVDRLKTGRYQELMDKAERFSKRFGAASVFLSRWLVSPVGPYLNYVVGMGQMRWARFTAMAVSGEAIWIGSYLFLGHLFSASISKTDNVLANMTWFAGAAIATVVIGRRFARAWRRAAYARSRSIGGARPDDRR